MRAATGPRSIAPLLIPALLLVAVTAGCTGACNPCADESPELDAKARADYYRESAKTYYDGGRYDAAVRMWDKVLAEEPNDQWAKFGLAKSLQMVGTPQSLRRAEAVLKDIVSLDWNHPTLGDRRFEVQTTLANVYSSLADYYDRDLRILERRLANDPNADTATTQQQIARQKGMRDDLLRKSIPVWTAVLNQSPDNPYALAGLSKANLLIGSEDMGIYYAERYIKLSHDSQLGWRKQLKDYETQMKGRVTKNQRDSFMEKIYGARDKELGMHLLLGSVYMRREQFSKAVEQYDDVVALDSATPAAYVERAQAYAAMGLYSQSVKDLEQYLRITDPERDRGSRVNAADLLDRYRRLAGQTPLLQPKQPAAPPPPPSAPASPSSQAYGSPDGG